MLSRNAHCIYWMSRYMERAENMARLLDALYQISLLPTGLDHDSLCSPLSISDAQEQFKAENLEHTIENVLNFCTLNRQNQASLYSCIRQARDNAHVVRGLITTEMWESINTTWIQLEGMTYKRQSAQGYRQFLYWVKERSHLFRGVTFGTIRRNQTFGFCRLGTFMERADNTLDILNIQANASDRASNSWEILLHSLSALESYREVYRSPITPKQVAQLLLLDESFPRSLHSSILETRQTLEFIKNVEDCECMRISSELIARLQAAEMDQGIQPELTLAIVQYMDIMLELATSVHNTFFEVTL